MQVRRAISSIGSADVLLAGHDRRSPTVASLVCAGLSKPFIDSNNRLCRIGSSVTLGSIRKKLGVIDSGGGFFTGFEKGALTYLASQSLYFNGDGNGNHYKGNHDDSDMLYFVGSNFSLTDKAKLIIGDERKKYKGVDRNAFMTALERNFALAPDKPYIFRLDMSCSRLDTLVARPQERAGGKWSDCVRKISISHETTVQSESSWYVVGFRLPPTLANNLGPLAVGGYYLHASAVGFMGNGYDGGVVGDFVVGEVSYLETRAIDEVVILP